MDFKQLFKSWVLIALGVLLAANTSSGIQYSSTEALVIAVLLLSLCNIFLKPLLMLFSLPFIVLTFGLGIWLINALLFLLVGWLVNGFEVLSFKYALWGALLVSVTGGVANLLFGTQKRPNIRVHLGGTPPPGKGRGEAQGPDSGARRTRKDLKDDDVIDV